MNLSLLKALLANHAFVALHGTMSHIPCIIYSHVKTWVKELHGSTFQSLFKEYKRRDRKNNK